VAFDLLANHELRMKGASGQYRVNDEVKGCDLSTTWFQKEDASS
jgi:hypothetical protein